MFISIQNSKTGPSFNLPAGVTCPGKTDICASLCYADKGRMGLPFQKAKRTDNLSDVIKSLKADPLGNDLANKLDRAIKRAKIATLRIHDSGDFFSETYTRVWKQVCRRNPDVRFWAYTRSFSVASLQGPLRRLASIDNVALWISADVENWQLAIAHYGANREFAGIAWMQTEGSEDLARAVQQKVGTLRFVNFPLHGGRSGSKHVVDAGESLRNCPVTVGKLEPNWRDPPCVRCSWCLPDAAPKVVAL